MAKTHATFFTRLSVGFSIISLLALSYICYSWYNFLSSPLNVGDKGMFYQILPGTSAKELSYNFADTNITANPYHFLALIKLKQAGKNIQAGEYFIPAHTRPLEFLDSIVQGKTFAHSITFIEGSSIFEVLSLLKKSENLQHDLTDLSEKNIILKINDNMKTLEGNFYPDTYHYSMGDLESTILKKSYAKMQKVLQREWENRAKDLPYKNSFEALVLASIIEKETAQSQELELVAGVFVNRLKKNMYLQADPTVIYALGKKFDGNIKKADLKFNNSYNTYVNKGLPPGPICLPHDKAIKAALNPDLNSGFLYFVAKSDGSHYFSKDLIEHNKAVVKYQLNKK